LNVQAVCRLAGSKRLPPCRPTASSASKMEKMRATVFHGMNNIRVEEVERPR
jgi:hypothetical protein